MVLNRRIPLLVILSCCFSLAHASELPASSTLHLSCANSFNLSRQHHVGDARSQVSSSSPLATNHNILIGPHSTLPRRSALCFASHQCTIKNGIHSHRLNPRQIHNFVAIPQNPLVKQREVGPFCGDAGLSVSTSSNDIGSGKKRNTRSNKSDTKSKNDINYVVGNPGKRKRMRKSEIDDLVRGTITACNILFTR